MREDGRKNIGSAVPLGFYNSLGIEKALRSAGRESRAGYDINAVMRLLVLDRLLDPSSKYSAWDGRGGWFFRSDFTDDDLYGALDSRPIYVRTKKHIKAHFLICYIALVVSRLMQHSLGGRYSVAAMLEDLKKVSGSHLEGNWWLFDHRSS
jgi:hypothetical protein